MLSRGQQKGLEKAISHQTRERRTRRLGLICFRRRKSTAAEPPQLQLPCALCGSTANIIYFTDSPASVTFHQRRMLLESASAGM